jgi:hypothetical protein
MIEEGNKLDGMIGQQSLAAAAEETKEADAFSARVIWYVFAIPDTR